MVFPLFRSLASEDEPRASSADYCCTVSDRITQRTVTVVTVGTLAEARRKKDEAPWETVEVHFLRFESLPSRMDECVESPRFSCFGHKWSLELYPGGTQASKSGYVTLFLNQFSATGSIEVEYRLSVRDEDGDKIALWDGPNESFELYEDNSGKSWDGAFDFAKRSNIVSALVDGALVVEVRMKLAESSGDTPVPQFIPDNPVGKNILRRFNDKETADVRFEVGGGSEPGRGARKKVKTSPVTFYAHRAILEDSASTLAEHAKSAKNASPIQITDVKPWIFHDMLHYIYGGEVLDSASTIADAKDLIDAADKFGVVHLKLQAEACYARTTELTFDNAIDNLLYADAKNLALLKEAVMDFLVQNATEAVQKLSFDNVPGYLMKDLLTAMNMEKTEGGAGTADSSDFGTARVGALRQMLHEKGLEVDGSREAMIALLEESS